MTLPLGTPAAIGDFLPSQQYNRMVTHWRQADPRTNLTDPQPGHIVSDSVDERLYHYQAAAWKEIVQIDTQLNNNSEIIFGTGSGIKSVGGALGIQIDQVQNVAFWAGIGSGNPDIEISGWDANAAALDTYSIGAKMDAGAGTRLTFGLDEVMRTMVICQYSDRGDDFGLAAKSDPTLYIMRSNSTEFLSIEHNVISCTSSDFYFQPLLRIYFNAQGDVSVGDRYIFNSNAGVELTDTDGQQAFALFEMKVNQTGTAASDGIYVNGILTSEGDGSTGDGNNYLRLATGGTTVFRVDNTGGIHPDGIKSGATQGAAGAAAGELWHDTDDNLIKMGV